MDTQDTEGGQQPTEALPREQLTGRARSLANLAPRWRPGQSGNPSGLTKDGKYPKGAALEARLLEQLAAPRSKNGKRTWAETVVDSWLKAAANGDAAARRDILDRLYPVPEDAGLAKRVVLEGIRLELTQGGASLTIGEQDVLAGTMPQAEPPRDTCIEEGESPSSSTDGELRAGE